MSTDARPAAALLVTDLDNTLWDWFAAWHASFSPMLQQLVERSGVPQDTLEREIRAIHQYRGTSEYSHLVQELPSLQQLHGSNADLSHIYNTALHTQNSERKSHTKLYPGAMEALANIRSRGVPIVAYTESVAFWTEWRIREVGLDGIIDVLYSSPDHDWPDGVEPAEFRMYPPDHYGLKLTKHLHVDNGVIKPNTKVLDRILSDYGTDPKDTVYVGDSLTKDVLMAQAAGVHDVHAAYGVSDARPGYDLLRRVSHWTDEMVNREREAAAGQVAVQPSHSIDSFEELIQLFRFTRDDQSI